MTYDTECPFFGMKLPKGKSETISLIEDEDLIETVHLTQVALGANPAKGPHVVFITKEDGEKIAICTLDSDRFPHTSINITVATGAISLSHTGNSDVFVSGYRTTSLSLAGLDDEDDYPFYMDGKPISLLAGEGDSDSEDDESSSEEEESSDDEDDDAAPMAVRIPAGADSSSEEEESSDEEDEEEEEEEEDDELGFVDLEAAAEDTGDDSDFDDDDMEEGEEEEEESSNDDDDDDEEEEIDLGAIIKGAGKRTNNNQSKTPQPPLKKQKAEKQAPATAPAKTAAVATTTAAAAPAADTKKATANGDKNADGVKEFEGSLAAYLKLKGPTKLSVLGQFVPRPKEGPKIKMKPFLNDRKAKFSYDEKTDLVSLAE